MSNIVDMPDEQQQFEIRVNKMLENFGIHESDLALGIMCQGRQYTLRELLLGVIHASFTVAKEEVYQEALAEGIDLRKPTPTRTKVLAIGEPGKAGFTPTRRR